LRGAAHGFEECPASLVRGGDVEQNDFVCTLLGVAMSERGWVARIDEIDELDAFDDSAITDVEAGYDAAGQHVLAARADAPRERVAAADPSLCSG